MDKGNSQPLINLLTFQEVAFWLRLRTMFSCGLGNAASPTLLPPRR